MKQEVNDNPYPTIPTISGCIKEEHEDALYKPTGEMTEPDGHSLDKMDSRIKTEKSFGYGSDAWLRHNVEMDEIHELNQKLKQENDVIDSKSGTSSVDSETHRDDYEEADKASRQPNENKKVQKEVRVIERHLKTNNNLSNRYPIVVLEDFLKRQNLRRIDDKRYLETETQNNQKSQEDEIRKTMMKKVIKGTSESSVAANGLNTFHCPNCPTTRTFQCWDNFCKHMRLHHKESLKKSDHQKFLKVTFYHTCKICFQKVLSNSSFLRDHLRYKHGVSVREYKKQFNFQSGAKAKLEIELQKGRLSKLFIGNMCTFKCCKCKKIWRSLNSFWKHFFRSQECSFKPNANSLYESANEVVTHKCGKCLKLMLCDKESILQHVSKVHVFKNLEHYARQFGFILEKQKMTKNEYTLHNLSQSAEFQKKVGHFCRFSCQMCGHVSNSWRNMKRHLNKKRHVSPNGKDWPNYISKTILHKCLICGKTILNDNIFVDYHMRKSHHHSVGTYIEKFLL